MRGFANQRRPLALPFLAAILLAGCGDDGGRPFEARPVVDDPGWPTYAGAEGGTRYSPLNQINRSNVQDLEIAWIYNAGHLERAPQLRPMVGFQVTPILLPEEAGRHLVLCDPLNRVMALDPSTGEERWLFDPEIDLRPFAGRFNCRGVTYWRDPEAAEAEACAHRLVLATNDRRLAAVDARNGELCEGFGEGGFVDVTPIILELQPANQLLTMQLNSPVAVVNGVVVVGGTADKFRDASSMNGAVRAFGARTGEHLWTFDTLIREPADDPESSARHVGGANAWINFSWDSEHDLVFVPTASPAPNFYGGKRPGDNLYANSVIVLRAATGELVWHYQVLHHDLWDWDLPTNPILAEISRDGEKVPVAMQLTKQGMIFTFHRYTGEPFYEIEERPVPTDGLPEDDVSPTQPFPVKPPPLVKHGIGPEDAWGLTPYDRNKCRELIESMRHGPIYTPPTTEFTLMMPNVGGGMNWGGGAFDPNSNILVTPVGQSPYRLRLIPNEEIDPVAGRLPTAGLPIGPPGYIEGTDYGLEQGPLFSPFMMPCTAPPWAKLVAVDMAAGEILWEQPLGLVDKLAPVPIPLRWGTPYAGGPIATGGGLVFIGATADERFRAYDTETGELLWEFEGPTSANATPMTYMAGGRQYVVVATGGHNWVYPYKKGDSVVAYSLPGREGVSPSE